MKPGVIFEVSGCGDGKSNGVDTNIYDVYGWGLQNTEKTDTTDLFYVASADGQNYNMHTFYINDNNYCGINVITNKQRYYFSIFFNLNNAIHYFFNNISHDLIPFSYNVNMHRKFNVNNINIYRESACIGPDGTKNGYTKKDLVNFFNNLRPFIICNKMYKLNDHRDFSRLASLNIFTHKLNYNFFDHNFRVPTRLNLKSIGVINLSNYKNIFFDKNNKINWSNPHYNISILSLSSYEKQVKYYVDPFFEFYYGSGFTGQKNRIDDCYSYPGIDNTCLNNNFTDPRGLLANVTNINGGGGSK